MRLIGPAIGPETAERLPCSSQLDARGGSSAPPTKPLPEAELGPSSLERAVRELVEAESSREMSVEGVLGVD